MTYQAIKEDNEGSVCTVRFRKKRERFHFVTGPPYRGHL